MSDNYIMDEEERLKIWNSFEEVKQKIDDMKAIFQNPIPIDVDMAIEYAKSTRVIEIELTRLLDSSYKKINLVAMGAQK